MAKWLKILERIPIKLIDLMDKNERQNKKRAPVSIGYTELRFNRIEMALCVCLYVLMVWMAPVSVFAAQEAPHGHNCCEPTSHHEMAMDDHSRGHSHQDCDPKACQCLMTHCTVFLAPLATPFVVRHDSPKQIQAIRSEDGLSRSEMPLLRPPRP